MATITTNDWDDASSWFDSSDSEEEEEEEDIEFKGEIPSHALIIFDEDAFANEHADPSDIILFFYPDDKVCVRYVDYQLIRLTHGMLSVVCSFTMFACWDHNILFGIRA